MIMRTDGSPDIMPTFLPTTNRPLNAGASLNDNTSRLDAVPKVTGAAKFGKDCYFQRHFGVFSSADR